MEDRFDVSFGAGSVLGDATVVGFDDGFQIARSSHSMVVRESSIISNGSNIRAYSC